MKTNKIVQGAMIASIIGVVALLNTYTSSTFDVITNTIIITGMAYFGYYNQLRDTLTVGIASSFIIFLLGMPFVLITSICAIVFGTFIGTCLRKKRDPIIIIGGGTCIHIIYYILIYEVFAKFFELDIVLEMTEMYEDLIHFIPTLSKYISLETALTFIPMFILIVAFMQTYMQLLFSNLLLKRLKVETPGTFHISTLHIPKNYGLPLLILHIIIAFIKYMGYMRGTVIDYLYYLGVMIFLFEGIAYLSFVLTVKGQPQLTGLLIFLLFIPVLYPIVEVIGVIDIFADIRETYYNKRKENAYDQKDDHN